MPYPMREVSVGERDKSWTSYIDVRGKCTDIPEENQQKVVIGLVLNGISMKTGLSHQQKKVGIGVLQQMFVEGLKFFGQHETPEFLPGSVVRVLSATDEEDAAPRYIGVVQRIDNDRLWLLTFDNDANEITIRLPLAHYVLEHEVTQHGIDGLKNVIGRDVINGTPLPSVLINAEHHLRANASSAKRQMQAEGEPRSPGDDPVLFDPDAPDTNFGDPELQELLRKCAGVKSEADWEEIKTLQQLDASIVKDVMHALSIAKAQGESEVQLVPTDYAFLVRIRRKAGRFITLEEYSAEHGAHMILVLKSMAKMSLDGSQVVDEGFIEKVELNGVQRRLHISTIWARGGEMALVQFIDGVVHRPCDNANPETVFAPSEIEALIEGAREGAVSDSERNADRALSSVMRSPEGDRIFSQLYQLTSQRDVVDPHTYTGEITALVGLIRHSLQAHSVGIEILHSESADIEDRVRELLGGNASITYSPPDNCSIERLFNLVRALCGGLPHASKGIGGSFVLHLPSGPIVCTVAPSIDQRGKRLVLAVTES